MATYTPNYNLVKPDYEEPADVAQLNNNADLIDAALAGKQNTLTFDSAPTSGSANPVTSGGVYTGLAGKAGTVTLASGTDADTLKTNGLYYLPDNGVNLPNNAVNGFILVISNATSTRAKQLFMRHGTQGSNDYQTYVRQYNGSTWGSWTKILTGGEAVTIAEGGTGATTAAAALTNLGAVAKSDYAYAAGDTFKPSTSVLLPSLVTGSTKRIILTIPTPKSLSGISTISVTSLKGGVRIPSGGYLGSGNASSPWASFDSFEWVGASGITISAAKSTDNLIQINIDSSTAYTSGNTTTALSNNIPVAFYCNWTLSFS